MSDDKHPEFRRVYQGGHHDVWCNGDVHQPTYGGWCHADADGGLDKPMPGRERQACDCAYWGNK